MGAEIGRISGPLLSADLLRNGVDLAFETDLLYLDVNNGRIGINTDTPSRSLAVLGTSLTDYLIVDTRLEVANNFYISTDRFQTVSGSIIIQPDQLNDPKIVTTKVATSRLEISDRLIENIVRNTDLEISTIGNGRVVFNTSNVDVQGNLHSTGNITLDGNIVVGDDDSDNITFNSEVNSNIIPNIDQTYDLGTVNKVWNQMYVKDILSDSITSTTLTVNNIDLLLTQGNTIYVSVNGSDTNTGEHLHSTFRTIKHALSLSQSGDEIVIFPGNYEEIFPLTVPQGVSVKGAGIRSVSVKPTVATNDKDAFLLNGETTVSYLTVKDFYYNSNNNTGYAFRFANNMLVTSRSPYVFQCTVITQEGTSVGETPADIYSDSLGLAGSYSSDSVAVDQINYTQSQVESWIGKLLMTWNGETVPVTFYEIVDVIDEPLDPGFVWRIILDRDLEDPGEGTYQFSIYPNNGETLIVGTAGYTSATDYSRSFLKSTLPPFFATTVTEFWTCQIGESVNIVDSVEEDPANSNWWRVNFKDVVPPTTGLPIFTSPSGSAATPAGQGILLDGSVVNETSREASGLFFSITLIIPNAEGVTVTNGARCEWLNSFTYFANRGIHLVEGTLGFASQGVRFGAEMRSINSANVYGTYGAVANGENTLAYLIGHNFGYIGSGTNSFNDRSLVIQANEVVEINSGRIYFDSMDHKGDYRVGDIFYVNQETGQVSFDAQSIDFGSLGNITLESPGSITIIDKSGIQTGNIRFYDNNVVSLLGPVNLFAASTSTYLNTDVYITGLLNTSGNVLVKGQVYLGNDPLDLITISPKLTQDINPNTTDVFTLGSDGVDPRRWNTVFLTGFDIDGVVDIRDNTISTLIDDLDLELAANGTGILNLYNTDVQIDNNLTVNGTFTVDGLASFKNIEISGITTLVGDFNQTGASNTYITGTFYNDNIESTNNGFFEVTSLNIFENSISATEVDADIIFAANGTGSVIIENFLKISDSRIENVKFQPQTEIQASIVLSPNGSGNTVVSTSTALKLPVGNDTIRSLAEQGEIRYNSVTNLYEGWQPNGLASFYAVYDSDRNTYVTPELTRGANDNTLRFGIDSIVKATIDSTKLKTDLVHVDQIRFSTSTINNLNSANDIIFSPNGTGYLEINGVGIRNNEINNNSAGPLVLSTTGIGFVRFAGTSALYIPYGTTTERRSTPEVGEVRNNSTVGFMEVYSGNLNEGDNGWIPAIGTSGAASLETVNEIMDIWTLILG
jgi:hypothetical protein